MGQRGIAIYVLRVQVTSLTLLRVAAPFFIPIGSRLFVVFTPLTVVPSDLTQTNTIQVESLGARANGSIKFGSSSCLYFVMQLKIL